MDELLKPDVFCPKRGERVPIWMCLGSFVQGVPTCEELVEASLNISENWANVRCNARDDRTFNRDEKGRFKSREQNA